VVDAVKLACGAEALSEHADAGAEFDGMNNHVMRGRKVTAPA
jgi:hypothetical protein